MLPLGNDGGHLAESPIGHGFTDANWRQFQAANQAVFSIRWHCVWHVTTRAFKESGRQSERDSEPPSVGHLLSCLLPRL